jgi:hypothetical protein
MSIVNPYSNPKCSKSLSLNGILSVQTRNMALLVQRNPRDEEGSAAAYSTLTILESGCSLAM